LDPDVFSSELKKEQNPANVFFL